MPFNSKEKRRANDLKNRQRNLVYRRKYYSKNKEIILDQNKSYRIRNKEKVAESRKIYAKNNSRYISMYKKEYAKKNKVKINEYHRLYRNKRRLTDIKFHLTEMLRTRLNHAVRRKTKLGSSIKDMGCTIEELKKYIESKFVKGMNWSNRGKWHLDHIFPISKFDLTNRKQFLKAVHYTNLQPLWAKDNRKKSDSIDQAVFNSVKRKENFQIELYAKK